MDWAEPFLTFLEDEENPTFNTPEEEVAKLDTRCQMIDRFLEGKEHPDTILDMLAEHGLDPKEWCEAVGENINLIIYQNVPVDLAGFHYLD